MLVLYCELLTWAASKPIRPLACIQGPGCLAIILAIEVTIVGAAELYPWLEMKPENGWQSACPVATMLLFSRRERMA